MSDLNIPTIIYPNGGETITNRSVVIEWVRPNVGSDSDHPIVYELFYANDWNDLKQTEWKQIATIPGNTSSFLWQLPFSLKGDKFRVGIRSRNFKGAASKMTISADNFTIQTAHISPPALISPVDSGSYHQFVPITLDHNAIKNNSSQRALYSLMYSSVSNNIDWTVIKDNVEIGSEPFLWDIRNLPAGSDYEIKVILSDSFGNASVPSFIRNIHISALNYFLLDTLPPKGKVEIQNSSEYTNERNVIIKLTAFDETTDVQSVILQQSFNGETVSGTEQDMANLKTWYLTEDEDGVRCIQAKFKDYAGNSNETADDGEYFRKFIDNSNQECTSFLAIKNGDEVTVYSAFGGSSPKLFKNKSQYLSLDGEVLAMAVFNSLLYLGIKKEDNTGILQKIEDDEIDDLQSFTAVDSAVTALSVFGGKLYIGLQNGNLYNYSGSSVTFVKAFSGAIESLYSDGRVLLISVENDDSEIYDGSIFTNGVILNGTVQIGF